MDLGDVLLIIGIALVIFGVGWIYPPAAAIVGGLLMVVIALAMENMKRAAKKPKAKEGS
jgi:hypothetical protein